jgi:hypothetical protein
MLALAMPSAELAAQNLATSGTWGNMSLNNDSRSGGEASNAYLAFVTSQSNGVPLAPASHWFNHYAPRLTAQSTSQQGQPLFTQQFSAFRLGPELSLMNRSLLRPFAELNWTRDAMALAGREQDQSHAELAAGAQFDLRWDLNGGAQFGLTAELLGGAVVDGVGRVRPVAFIVTPAAPLQPANTGENTGFARGRLGLNFDTAEGLNFHVGMDGRLAEDHQDNWQADAGISVSF